MTNLNEMNIEFIRKKNNLKPKNKKAFEYVARGITNNVMLSEDESDEIIIEILEDLLIAQNNGTSAEVFFGSNLDNFIKELTSELPRRSFKSFITSISFNLSIILIVAFFILGFTDVVSLASTGNHIDIPVYPTIISVFFMIFFSSISVFLKNPQSKNKRMLRDVVGEVFSWLIYAIFYISFNLLNTAPYFKFPFYLSFILCGLSIYISVSIKRKYFPKKQFI